MKKLIYLLFLIPLLSRSQNESSIISVTLEARDCEFIGSITGEGDFFQDLDSVLKNRFRPPSIIPTGTTTVILNGATAGVWFDISKRLRRDAAALVGNNNPFSRVDAALRLVGNAYLTAALNADVIQWDTDGYTDKRSKGRKRIKREP